jgi:hypothetical protein
MNTGQHRAVSAQLARSGKPNKIMLEGLKANYAVRVLANCKTVYTSSILVVASINLINALH